MTDRLSIRLDDPLLERLSDVAKVHKVDRSTIVRRAIIAYLDRAGRTEPPAAPPHDREACAQAILAGCPFAVRSKVAARLKPGGDTRSGEPSVHQIGQQGVDLFTILRQGLIMFLDRTSQAQQPAGTSHTPDDCAWVVLARCPPDVQASMAHTQANSGIPLIRLMRAIMHNWADFVINHRL
jgi:hypothetical protein